MRRNIVSALALSILFISGPLSNAGHASDMPVKAPPPVAAPAWSWTGFYVGANGGYARGDNGESTTYTNLTANLVAMGSSADAKGGFGGGQIGYNWQTGVFVFGGEADFQGAGIRNSVSGLLNDGVTVATATQRLHWFGTVRGRVGYAFDRTLIYFTGGYAGGQINNTALLSAGVVVDKLVGNTSRSGLTLGGGLEYSLSPAWSAKVEYQYLSLENETLSGGSVNGLIVTNTIRDRFNTVRFGVNYHVN